MTNLGYVTFGLLLHGGKGFKIFSRNLFENIKDEVEFQKLIQLPKEITVKKDSEIWSMLRFQIQDKKSYYFLFIKYVYAGIDTTGRVAYYAGGIGYKFTQGLHPDQNQLINLVNRATDLAKEQIFGEETKPFIIPSFFPSKKFNLNYENSSLKKQCFIKIDDIKNIDTLSKWISLAYSNELNNYGRLWTSDNDEVFASIDKSLIDISSSQISEYSPNPSLPDLKEEVVGILTTDNWNNGNKFEIGLNESELDNARSKIQQQQEKIDSLYDTILELQKSDNNIFTPNKPTYNNLNLKTIISLIVGIIVIIPISYFLFKAYELNSKINYEVLEKEISLLKSANDSLKEIIPIKIDKEYPIVTSTVDNMVYPKVWTILV
jgi:hypothetical protein